MSTKPDNFRLDAVGIDISTPGIHFDLWLPLLVFSEKLLHFCFSISVTNIFIQSCKEELGIIVWF